MGRDTRRSGAIALALLALLVGSASAAPPVIVSTSFSGVTTSSAVLRAEIDPKGKEARYHFEYGTSPCISNSCTKVPVPEGAIAAGAGAVSVAPLQIEGLAPSTTYHLRVVAKNPEKAEGTEAVFTTHRLSQAFGPCLDDVFRTGGLAPLGEPSALLPDCRAYEQASPVEKNGVDARGRFTWARTSLEGNGIVYGATSGIPGAEGSQELPFYLATRGGGAWSTQGLLPPPSAGQNVAMLGWSPDFSQSFSAADNKVGPLEDIALLSRSSTGGSLREVVPYGSGLEAPRLASSSPDGSRVVFESKTKLLPAAVAGASNVYFWDRSSGKLSLASVLNSASTEGESPPEGAFAGAYDWIGGTSSSNLHRGGAAASYYTHDEHTLASSGSVIFTAAGTGQLYMRVNPGRAQSALDGAGKCTDVAKKACTLHISATQRTLGKGEGGTDAAGTQPAAFMGAAADGSSVLFTSSEKLTNDATTGPEPSSAALGRANIVDGSGKDLELCLAKAKGVAVDGSHLYWANSGAGTIGRADLNCSSASREPQFITGADNPQYVALAGGYIYWTNAADGAKEAGTIGRAKLGAGGAEEVEEDYVEGATNPQGIAVDSEHLYWANAGNEDATRTIGQAKLGAGGAEEVNRSFIAVGDASQKFTPQGIAVNATHLYMTIDGAQEFSYLFRYDIGGNPVSREIFFDFDHRDLPGDRGVALDASHVYWSRQGGDSVGRINLNLESASAERAFIGGAGHPGGLAADATHLYWSVNGETPVNPGNDLYRYEPSTTTTGQLSDLSVDEADSGGAEVLGLLGASEDAKKVYFVANGVLATGAQPGDCKGAAEGSLSFSGQCSLYMTEEGEPTLFIARLDASGSMSDALDWLPKGELSGQIEKTARVSADGSTVLFRSQRKLSAYDNEGVPELYRYHIGDAGPSCISCNPTVEAPVGTPEFGNINFSAIIPADPAFVLSRNLSADGRRAFFQAADPLVAADTNGADGCPNEKSSIAVFLSCQDAYEWEAQGTGSCPEDAQDGGCLYLLSTGKSEHASFLLDASPSGDDAFVATSSPNLVRQDQDQLVDVYDVRVQGGLSAQNQPPPPLCESGESCRPTTSAVPGFQAPATATFAGPGNAKSACPPGKRQLHEKGRRRCVAKHRKHRHGHRKHERAAKHGGGSNR